MVKNLNSEMDYKISNNFKIEYNHSDKIFYFYFFYENKWNLLYKNEFSEIEKEYSIPNIGYLLILRDTLIVPFEAGYYFLLFNPKGKLISKSSFVAPYGSMPDVKNIQWKNKRKLTLELSNNLKLNVVLISFLNQHKLIGFST